MNLILLHPDELRNNRCVQLADRRAEHICQVLHAEPGKTLRIGLLNGPQGLGTVKSIFDGTVTLYCEFDAMVPQLPLVDLLLALPRPKVMKRLWAQLSALGVRRVILTNAEKVERYYFDSHVLAPDFYNPRLIEGLQQAADTLLPEVRIVKELKPFLEDELDGIFPDVGKRILADPSGARNLFQTLGKTAENLPDAGKRILLAVGPEGGWTPYELEQFKAHSFEIVGMGPRILRTETACVALLSLLTLHFAPNEK
jgi:RsmE family RNA methyltransferase